MISFQIAFILDKRKIKQIRCSSFSLQLFKDKRKPTAQEIEYIQSFSQLIEVIYDPYLTWRNFLHGHFADYRRILTSIVQLHVELVPCIYGILNKCLHIFLTNFNCVDKSLSDCFQFETIIHLPEIGVPLVHMLGAIISGSQVIKHVFGWLLFINIWENCLIFLLYRNIFECRNCQKDFTINDLND